MKITIKSNVLKALSLFALPNKDKRDPRTSLRGVYFEWGRATATNGAVLLTAGLLPPDNKPEEAVNFIVPLKMLEGLPSGDVPVTVETAGTEVVVSYQGTTLRGEVIDGQFPDYRRIFPEGCSEEACHFTAKSLSTFVKAADILYGTKAKSSGVFQISMNGPRTPSLVCFSDMPVIGLMQPCSKGNATFSTAAWARSPVL